MKKHLVKDGEDQYVDIMPSSNNILLFNLLFSFSPLSVHSCVILLSLSNIPWTVLIRKQSFNSCGHGYSIKCRSKLLFTLHTKATNNNLLPVPCK